MIATAVVLMTFSLLGMTQSQSKPEEIPASTAAAATPPSSVAMDISAIPAVTAHETTETRAGAPVAKNEAEAKIIAKGKKVIDSHHCLDCHTMDGGPSAGPTWKGLYGSTRTRTDGKVVKVDEADMREVIRTVLSKFYKPYYIAVYKDKLPGYELSEEELTDVIEYIKLVK